MQRRQDLGRYSLQPIISVDKVNGKVPLFPGYHLKQRK